MMDALFSLLGLCLLGLPNLAYTAHHSPLQPLSLTWVISSAESGDVLNQTTHLAPSGTWFPDLYFDLGKLLKMPWDADIIQNHFYVCPGHGQDKTQRETCGGADSYYCASWSCVSTGHTWWTPPKQGDLITVTRAGHPACPQPNGPCNPVLVQFTDYGKNASGWMSGKTWGLRLYEKTRLWPSDKGALFTIRLFSQSLQPPKSLGPARPESIASPKPEGTGTSPFAMGIVPVPSSPWPFGLLAATYQVLNASRPNLTRTCWLCLDTKLPYYEGIAITRNYTNSPNTKSCRWQQLGKGRLTLQSVTGSGLCVGQPPQSYSHLCNQTESLRETGYLIPPDKTWWACASGLTTCVHTQVLNQTKDFCVLVQLVPKVTYYSEEEIYHQLEPSPGRAKREAITAVFLSSLLHLGLDRAIGSETSSLILQDKEYKALSLAIDADIATLGKSVSSLAEVVFQNRRRLNLLLLQQRGLCLALGEQCCVYANHTGVTNDSMSLLRKRLHDRKLEKQQNEGWYESLYNQSPWLTTLLSALTSFLFLLLMVLTCGYCITSAVVRYLNHGISKIQLMRLRQQYKLVDKEVSEI